MTPDLFRLDGKIALVTGGAHSIGFALAAGLARAGAEIAFNTTSPDHRESALEEFAKLGVRARGYVCDVTSEDGTAAMIAEIAADAGDVDILVNNAGVIRRVPMLDMPAGEFRRVVDVDLVGPYIMARAVLPGMIRKGGGKIINVCSLMSELGRETVSAYAAAKGGLKMLTKNIASEFGGCNIQCNGIGPGYIATRQTEPLRADGHPFTRFLLAKTPAGRWGRTDDLVGPVVFLASPASDFVNGHILYVDGGILAYLGKQP